MALATALAGLLYQRYGGDWSKVRAQGVVRPDGVIDLTNAAPNAATGGQLKQAPRTARKR